uniref:Valyl-tRNA synthetase n=1 Tax=Panagrellus redivivus TaxID=6233 RepID=A0A7E4VJ15_PANRE
MNIEQILDDTMAYVGENLINDPITPILQRAKDFVSTALNPKFLKPLKANVEERIKSLEAEIAAIEETLQKQAEAKAISQAKVMHEANVAKVYEEFLSNDFDDTLSMVSDDYDVNHNNRLKERRKALIAEMNELKQLLQIPLSV